jgi:hypothetical protein
MVSAIQLDGKHVGGNNITKSMNTNKCAVKIGKKQGD